METHNTGITILSARYGKQEAGREIPCFTKLEKREEEIKKYCSTFVIVTGLLLFSYWMVLIK